MRVVRVVTAADAIRVASAMTARGIAVVATVRSLDDEALDARRAYAAGCVAVVERRARGLLARIVRAAGATSSVTSSSLERRAA